MRHYICIIISFFAMCTSAVAQSTSTRSQTEQRFIDALQHFQPSEPAPVTFPDTVSFTMVEDSILVWPGESYMLPSVNRNTYYRLTPDTSVEPLCDSAFPHHTVANLLMFEALPQCNATVSMTVLRHEYRVKDSVTVTLPCLIQYCRQEGFTPYWGAISADDTLMRGSLIFFNHSTKQVHIFRIECDPRELSSGHVVLHAVASLYVPTSNVKNLYEQYKEKSADEIINYQ